MAFRRAEVPQLKYVDLTIKIIDSGAGISKEGLSKLFISFGKLDENSHLNREGTGLGLSICKSIIESQGGTVKVDSTQGKGTMFTINMKSKCKPMKTIWNESDAFISMSFRNIHESHNSDRVRLILEGSKKEKQFRSFISHIRDEAKIQQLFKVVEECKEEIFASRASPLALSPSSGYKDLSSISEQAEPFALIVNDDPMQLMVLTQIFSTNKFQVAQAINGLEAFKAVYGSLDVNARKFDLVIMDLNMPIMNGYDAATKIKALFSEHPMAN
jgi:hypothetical protein